MKERATLCALSYTAILTTPPTSERRGAPPTVKLPARRAWKHIEL